MTTMKVELMIGNYKPNIHTWEKSAWVSIEGNREIVEQIKAHLEKIKLDEIQWTEQQIR